MAQGDWLLFLHADTQLSPEWSAVVLNHIKTSQIAAHFRLKFRASGVAPALFASGANLRARLGLPYGDQALLISAVHYDKIGGFPDIPLMEDVAIVKKLHGQLIGLPATAETNAERYLKYGWLKSGGGNLWTLLRYLCGTSPEKLAKRYYR